MKFFLTHLFSRLQWYESAEYVLMALMAMVMPVSWRLGLWCMVLVLGIAVIKTFVTHRIGNKSLSRQTRICLYLMILYYLVHLISVAYSSAPKEGWDIMVLKLPLLLLPLYFLVSDTSYLRREHVSVFSYLLALVLSLRFLIMALRAIVCYIQGTPINLLIDFHFDPLHHNYLAMYILAALVLLYVELVHHGGDPQWRKRRWLVALDMLLLIMYLVIIGSRSGLVILAFLFIVCMFHLAVIRKKWILTGMTAVALALLIGVSYLAMPTLYWRTLYSIEKIAAGEQGDGRQVMWKCGAEALQGHELFGYGCGGYWDVLRKRYIAHDFAEGYTHEKYSTHNQYLETALSTGIVGTAILLAMILMPIIIALKRPRRSLPLFLFSIVYASCLVFEATFGRQMGLLFVCWWYGILLPTSHPSEIQS